MNTILLVDDESWTRETVKALIDFESLDITHLIEATNGEEALESIKRKRPDFIITDMKMPGIDGIGLLEVLEKDFSHIPVIVLSGYQDFVYTRQAIKSRVIEYLPKPVDGTELNKALEKALYEKRKWKQQQIGFPLFTVNPELEELIQPFHHTLAFSLKELNASELSKSIERFLSKLNDSQKKDELLIFHLHQEFLFLLKEALKEHDLRMEDIGLDWEQLSHHANITVEDELTNQLNIGKQIMIKFDEIRKQKNKINLEDIKDYIDNHSASPNLSLEMIAKTFFVSKEYLTTAFKKRYGCNVTEYIITKRMEKAKELIMTTSLQYKTIAEMVGYEDVSYFYRVFKKYFGTSPGTIRKT
ncbi:response regulator [uncultured Metabacillus sp.]|uniref:response regulator transcription factor n=1 Tax=uncultured Metabacillus sp. TaxID=2860135 RepID=UPI0026299D7E|nr:response regulator [uncultured Metabacillus sp.]